jgi:hypothetical protein
VCRLKIPSICKKERKRKFEDKKARLKLTALSFPQLNLSFIVIGLCISNIASTLNINVLRIVAAENFGISPFFPLEESEDLF